MSRRINEEIDDRSEEIAMMETSRSVAESSSKGSTEKKKDEEGGMSIFWRVFGGTILSITALIAVTLYNNMSSNIADLRAEVSREREARAELVKKEDFNARVTAQYERMRGIDSLKVEVKGLEEKVSTNSTGLETVKKDTVASVDTVKKDNATNIDALKRDIEAIKKDAAALEILKEKVSAIIVEMKSLRGDLTKLTGEVEKNQAYDLERKTTRDSQYKELEATMKEVQKALQDCREKLARLEGRKPMTKQPDEEK